MANEKLHISEAGMKFIANYEGCHLVAYDDLQPKKVLKKGDKIKGTLTIGYGHIEGVYIGQTITKAQAWQMFKEDLAKDYELRVKRQLKVEVSQTTFDALVSRAYNVGNVVNVAKAINNGDYELALKLMEKPNTSKGIVLTGLTKRRLAEKEMLKKGLKEVFTPQEDKELSQAVSKIIKSGIDINFNQWKRTDLIKTAFVPILLDKLGGLDKLVEKKIISDKTLWEKKQYKATHIRSLLIKYSKTL